MRTRHMISPALGVIVALALTVMTPAAASAPDDLASQGWVWPIDEVRITRTFSAPPHPYGRGHRGLDLQAGSAVRSPADGTVAFAGDVAGRPLVTIDHGHGLVTTLEPVVTTLVAGARVGRGEVIGSPAPGGHTGAGEVHFGVRLDDEYINPLRLLGGVPRAVLLPYG